MKYPFSLFNKNYFIYSNINVTTSIKEMSTGKYASIKVYKVITLFDIY